MFNIYYFRATGNESSRQSLYENLEGQILQKVRFLWRVIGNRVSTKEQLSKKKYSPRERKPKLPNV